MIKDVVIYIVAFAALFFVVYLGQVQISRSFNGEIRYNLWDVTMFFAVASALICIHLRLFSEVKALQPQLGFIYLPTLFIKGGLFFFAFKSTVFSIIELSDLERFCLLLPLLIFLILEVIFVIKILRRIDHKI